MADLHYLFNSINGGEMSPQMDLRIDNEKYNSGARVLENFIVKPYGGIYKRPGTEYICRTLYDQPARLESFMRNQQSGYVLEFTPGYLRVLLARNDESPAETGEWSLYNADGTLDAYRNYGNEFTNDGFALNGWEPGQSYTEGKGTYYNGQLFTANIAITATSTTDQPLSGANWNDYWTPYYYQKGKIMTILAYDTTSYIGYRCIQTNNIAVESILQNFSSPTLTEAFIRGTMASVSQYWEEIPLYPQIIFNTPYTADEIFELQVETVNDVVFITHKNHRPRRLTRDYADFWSFGDVIFDFAPALDVDLSTNVVQIQYDVNEWSPNTVYSIGDRVGITTAAYSTLTAVSAVGLFTCNTLHTSSSASNAATGKPGSTTGNWRQYWNTGTSNAKYNKWTYNTVYAKGQTVWYGKNLYTCKIAHTSDGTDRFRTLAAAQKTFGDTEPTIGKKWVAYWVRSGATTDLTDLRYKLQSEQAVFTQNSVGETWQIRVPLSDYFRRLELVGTVANATIAPTDEIFLQGQLLVSSRWDLGSAPVGTYYLEESTDGVTWTIIQLFIVESTKDNNISFTYQAPTKGAWYRLSGQRSGDVTAPAGARSILIEPANAILTVPFLISEYVDENTVKGYPTFNNNQILPEEAVGISTSYYKRPAFSASSGYPASVALHESRLWFGGVTTYPSRVWGSQKDDYYNFLLGVNASDALDLTLAAKKTNRIRWMKSFNKQLVVATDGEVYTVDAGESDASISPTTIRGRVRLYNGGGTIPGVITTDSLLYFQSGNRRLREFAYNFQTDSFVAPDMTVLADHVNGNGFKQAALMQNPDPVLWCVNNVGELLGFSYDRAQNITAWHRHTTGGARLSAFAGLDAAVDTFESVTTLAGPVQTSTAFPDEVWFVVKRTNGSGSVYYNIERFSPFVMSYIYGNKLGDGYQGLATDYTQDSYGAVRYGYLDSHVQSRYKFYSTYTSGVSAGQVVPVYAWDDLQGSAYAYNRYKINAALYNRKIMAVYTDGEAASATPINYPYSIANVSTESAAYANSRIMLPRNDGRVVNGGNPLFMPQMVIGLPVFSLYIPSRFDIKLDNGTSMGRNIRINRVQFKPWRTVGGKYALINSFNSTLSGGRSIELMPTYDSALNNISYQDFNFNITADNQVGNYTLVQYMSSRPWLQSYNGSTADIAINSNWTENPLFAVVHYDASSFNLLGMVWKMEVQGN